MYKEVRTVACAVLAALFIALPEPIIGKGTDRPPSNSSPVMKRYDQMIDSLFPRPSSDGNNRFLMSLRFLPSFHPESQIVLSYSIESRAGVEYLTLSKPLMPLIDADEARGLVRHPQELASLAGLKRSYFSVTPQQMKEWLRGLLDSLASSGPWLNDRATQHDGTREASVTLDGTRYVLELETTEDNLSLIVVASELDTGGESEDPSVVKWMNSVRREITKMAAHRSN
ncbi:MAG TPA: hypothetical protein VJK29_07190 [Terriglobales bacterium]|nr:hypothetical protein [Terriglobales bacterium]